MRWRSKENLGDNRPPCHPWNNNGVKAARFPDVFVIVEGQAGVLALPPLNCLEFAGHDMLPIPFLAWLSRWRAAFDVEEVAGAYWDLKLQTDLARKWAKRMPIQPWCLTYVDSMRVICSVWASVAESIVSSTRCWKATWERLISPRARPLPPANERAQRLPFNLLTPAPNQPLRATAPPLYSIRGLTVSFPSPFIPSRRQWSQPLVSPCNRTPRSSCLHVKLHPSLPAALTITRPLTDAQPPLFSQNTKQSSLETIPYAHSALT